MARASTLNHVLIAANGCEGPKWFQAGAAGIYIGYLVMYDDADEVKVATTSAAKLIGVAGCPSYQDSTDDFDAGTRVPVWIKGCGAEVWVTHDGTTGNSTLAVEVGDTLTFSNSTAGLVEVDAAYDIISIGWVTRSKTIATGVPANLRMILI